MQVPARSRGHDSLQGRLGDKTACQLVDKVIGAQIRTSTGEFLMAVYVFLQGVIRTEHIVLYKNVEMAVGNTPPLLRIHSACVTSEIFGDCQCDCSAQLQFAMDEIAREGRGMIIYHTNQEGRGTGLTNKLRSFLIMERTGASSAEAFSQLGVDVDNRSYEPAVAILSDFGIAAVRLITNNLRKISALERNHIRVHHIAPPLWRITEC
jgi:GTP cyclohydrolase II